MREEYEVISHNNANFNVFLVNLLYRTPHIHKDFEICLLLDGEISVKTGESVCQLQKNDIFVMNPFQSHEIIAKKPALILSVQVSPAFFNAYFPKMENIEFQNNYLHSHISVKACADIRLFLFEIAKSYFCKDGFFELKTASVINYLFFYMLDTQPHQLIPEKEKIASRTRGTRMRKIMEYIDEHYTEKLLLSHIAEEMGLDLFYLSHYFKECFGISFQEYISRIRCEHARQQLLLSEYSLLDISIACGFSDPKYFNKAFSAQFGCSPKQYRKQFLQQELAQQQKSMLTTQEFLSPAASLVTLENYI